MLYFVGYVSTLLVSVVLLRKTKLDQGKDYPRQQLFVPYLGAAVACLCWPVVLTIFAGLAISHLLGVKKG